MIRSNEPGHCKAREYGIKIENGLLVETREIPGAARQMFGVETLSFASIKRSSTHHC